MARVVHFEIHAEDPERAMRFYTDLFEWKFIRWPGPMDYWIVRTGSDDEPGIDGGLMKRMGQSPSDGQPVNCYVCTIEVTNLDERLVRAADIGAIIAVPKMPIPGVGWLAYIKDTEGNIFGMMQNDPGTSISS